jgi:hypothetical protein
VSLASLLLIRDASTLWGDAQNADGLVSYLTDDVDTARITHPD